MEEDEFKESLKNVSSKFLLGILEELHKLDFYETTMRQGCSNLDEYVINLLNRSDTMNLVRLKNIDFLIDGIDNVLKKIKPIISKTEIEYMEKELMNIRLLTIKGKVDKKGNKKEISEVKIVCLNPLKKSIELLPLFSEVCLGLSELKGKLYPALKHILFSQDTNKKQEKQR